MSKIKEEWKQQNGNYKCSFCCKEYKKYGIGIHIWKKHESGFDTFEKYRKENGSWNKGLTKESDERVRKNSESISEIFIKQVKDGIYKKRGFTIWDDEKRKFWSEKQCSKNTCTRVKWYTVNGEKVQGKWELNISLKLNELNIKWQRCKPFLYYKDNKEKRYSPDFYLSEYDLFEIKGYWWGDSKEKMKLILEQNNYLNLRLKIIETILYEKILKLKSKDEFMHAL